MNGPEPVVSEICWLIGVSATRLGMTNSGTEADLASVFSIRPNGSFSTIWKVRSSTAFIDWVNLASRPPCASLSVKRLIEGSDVGRGDRRAVVPLEPVAQLEGPGELVVAHRPALDHLRLRLELGVEREQRVVDQVAVVADDVGGGPDRIEDLQIRMHARPCSVLGCCAERRPCQRDKPKGRAANDAA